MQKEMKRFAVLKSSVFFRAGHILSVTISQEGSPRRLLESLHHLGGDVQEAVQLQLVWLRRHPFADAEHPSSVRAGVYHSRPGRPDSLSGRLLSEKRQSRRNFRKENRPQYVSSR